MVVLRAIKHAISARRPWARYVVPRYQFLLIAAVAVLPTRLVGSGCPAVGAVATAVCGLVRLGSFGEPRAIMPAESRWHAAWNKNQ